MRWVLKLGLKSLALLGVVAYLSFPPLSIAEEYCIYRNELGVKRRVRSIEQVPKNLRTFAQCAKTVSRPVFSGAMADPEEVDLDGNLRKESITSSVGPINLRWPRSAEKVLGKTPLRAMADAGRMVSKALKQEGFPGTLSSLDQKWEVVFMDENVPVAQIPQQLVWNCHPAWMTPFADFSGANIYVVVQRVAAGCGGGPPPSPSEVDAEMAEVLAHEMGHAVEAAILGPGAFGGERWRAEGFATFFERLASEYSQVIPSGKVSNEHRQLARQSFHASPNNFSFQGTAQDYARASMYLEALVKERGMKGLMRVYDRVKKGEGGVLASIESETGWSRKQIEERAREAAGL